ncbi:hypothetical protein HOT31_gp087 [Microbacterium phage Hendrix]|uniref:Uncharacterized protein n=1 Tax=Microbacterium phage Hendrix TaxID=2182341 RepID=A0A2U8UUB7_9CAUD|nr:hypothetical protein HOT31_gp087 [Microbacterium phage Hendrix]AWN07758.1 hypothetical protein PBI_HENDRIX_87 [Microbacterium phage Hendrix]
MSDHMEFDRYGMPIVWDVNQLGEIEQMSFPMRCMRCQHVHDTAKVEVVQRYADCTVWKCPRCGAHIDDRPIGWGGSAEPLSAGR